MRSTFKHVLAPGPRMHIRRRLNRLLQKRMRVLIGVLVLSLLLASLPVSADTTRRLPRNPEAVATQISVYGALTQTLASIGGWLTSHLTAKPRRSSFQPVTSYYTPPLIDVPLDLNVTATANNSIQLGWTAVSGAHHYDIERSNTIAGPFSSIGTTTATTYPDGSVTPLHAYLYRVRAVTSGGITSMPSNMAFGTAITFEFTSLLGQRIKAQHFHDVRTATNAVRALTTNLAQLDWAPRANLSGLDIKATDVQQIRDALDAALSALSVPVTAYQDSTLAAGTNGTRIQAVHIEQLQTRSTRGKSTSSGPADPDSSSARLDPMNEIGGGGDNPLSRNFNWNLGLINLAGRSGMDLSLTLSYNSLVWTKHGSVISFDDDRGFPSPGFRLGFPVIQAPQLNQDTGKYGYLLIGSDGSRTELRQVGTSQTTQTLFESADSSHTLLDTSLSLPAPNNDKLVLKTPDGVRMLYALKGVDYQCTEIRDRNGNYITINYTAAGKIDTIIDTLNREIKFNYFGDGLLEKITQLWKQGTANERTHTWATFEYTAKEIQTTFTDLTAVGAANGSQPKLLTKVTLADNSTTISNNSHFEFNYTSWGQVQKVSDFAPDGHLVNYRSYNLPLTNSPAQTDCPRFTERRDWAENWNRGGSAGNSGLPAGAEQEVLTTFAIPNINNDDEWTMPDGSDQVGTRTQVTVADGTSDEVTNEIYFIGKKNHSDGWQRKLPALVNTLDQNNVLRRQVMTTWTQDLTNVSYELNPRVEEVNIYDPSGLRKRTKTIYELATLPDTTTCQLPKDTLEYAADASTVLRSTRTEYEDDPAYFTRRIIGLVSKKSLYAGDVNVSGSTLMSEVEFLYDGENSVEGSEVPVQHDGSAFPNSFVIGRANVTTVKRYDVSDTTKFTFITNKYNRAGSVTSSKNTLNQEVTFSYTDAFASSGATLDAARSFSTFAYPTTVNDPDQFSRRARYDYDFGSQTWEQTPQPNEVTNVAGPRRTYTYDLIGRLERTTNLENSAFTRYQYGPNYLETFSSVNSTTESANEGHLVDIFDGLGRRIVRANEQPGPEGDFAAELVLYDRLGRAIKRSNQTETDISIAGTPLNPYQFAALGDDATANGGLGWKYTIQTYDWKDRPLVTTNTDGTTTEASYSNCGCAGSLVTTLTDEGTLVGGVIKRRQQKLYTDVLARNVKTENFDWNGNVYATIVNTYDVRDQLTQIRQYTGSEGSYQDTTFDYDGFGRLWKRHLPQQQADPNNQNTTDHTTWTYNDDDTVNTITDARGAVTTLGYAGTKRGLIKSVAHTLSGSEINISYTYDAAGNRKKMIDSLGSTTYTYDSLSRLQTESREITDSGFSGSGSYALTYGYNLADELTSITDPFQASINYSYNSATGRLTGITGSSYQGVTEYASQMSYRAFGGLKSGVVGTTTSNRQVSQKYNERLQATEFKLLQGSNILLGKQYTYSNPTTGNNDGRVKYSKDLRADQLDRSFQYDHVGRITFAKSGIEARRVIDPANTLNRPLMDGPYDQTFSYDAFDHMTDRLWRYFYTHYTGATVPGNGGASATYTNNRKQGWLYDPEGNLTQPGPDASWQYTYNPAGQVTNSTVPSRTTLYGYDGDGRLLKETIDGIRSYYLTSSLLGGQTVTELTTTGQKKATYIYQGQQVLAKQETSRVLWLQVDPAGTSKVWIDQNGAVTDRIELDPLGSQTGSNGYIFYSWEDAFGTGIYNYYQYQQQRYYSLMAGSPGSTVADSVNNAFRGCSLDGATVPCDFAMGLVNRGAATVNWNNPGNGLDDLFRQGVLEPIIDTRTVQDNPDSRPRSVSYISGYRFRLTPRLPATEPPPEPPAPEPGSFDDCYAKAGLQDTKFNAEAADLVLKIVDLEKISPELLAYTWMKENSDFSLRPNPNPNKHPEDIDQWDVGPFHINIHWTMGQIHIKEVSMKDLVLENVLGYNFYLSDMKTPAPFSGEPLSNGRMAARRLNYWGGTDENKATMYTKPSSRPDRREKFKKYGPKFKKFFDCYKKPPA